MKPIPLTKQQKRMYLEWEMNPLNLAYNIIFQFELEGKLEKKVLHKALQYLTKKHEALRTKFICNNKNQMRQIIKKSAPTHLKYYNLDKGENKSIQNMLSYLHEPFNINKEVLFRYILIKVENNKHILGLCWHHIIVDAASVKILLKDFSFAYNHYLENDVISFVQDDISLKEILIIDQKDTKRIKLCKDYWSSKTSDKIFNPNQFMTKTKNKNTNDYRIFVELTESLTKRLMMFVGASGITLFTALTSLFAILIHRYTQSPEINLLYSINIRSKSVLNKVGFFVNNLPLLCKIEPNIKLQYFISKINEQLNTDRLFKDITLFEILKDARKKQSMSSNSPFNILISQSTSVCFHMSLKGIDAKIIPFEEFEMIPDLDLSLRFDHGKRILLEFGITREFNRSYVENFIDAFVCILDKAIEEPQRIIQQLFGITEKERLLIASWNDTVSEYPKDKCIHDILKENAQSMPDAIAALDRGKHYTFSYIDKQMNKFAYSLLNNNVHAGDLVLVYLERNVNLLISMLAIYKVGAIYVPLSIDNPLSYNLLFIKQSKAKHILLPMKFEYEFREYIRINNVNLNINFLVLETIINSNVPPPETYWPKVSPSNIAYIIYTSGSTGVPKGAMISHQGMLNHIFAKIKDLELNETSSIIQNAPQIFDISIWQFLTTLVCKGTVHILSSDTSQDPFKLLHYIAKHKCTILEIVPSFLSVMLETLENNVNLHNLDSKSLEYILLTGETFSYNACTRWLKINSKTKVVNAYGPTECSDDVTHYIITNIMHIGSSVPIGRAINNTQIHILDEYLDVLPIGSIGEIYVEGDGVGYGYIDEPSKTALSFVPNPFSKGTRLYKTGDLGRYLEDGNIDFLGRIDHQVKVRGVRIELGEIETTLQSIDGVKQCVVMAREDIPNQKKLVGYIVLEKNKQRGEVLKKCEEVFGAKLPNSMQLSQIMLLKKLPLNPNGKIDRKSLPTPKARSKLDAYDCPIGSVEQELTNIWQEMLKIDVGRNDNFFSLGGDSIISIQIASKARKKGIIFDVKQVFKTPTIAGLAAHIIKKTEAEIAQPLAVGIAPLTPIQSWFFEVVENVHHFNQAFWMIPKNIHIDIVKLRNCLIKIYNYHDALRFKYRKTDGNQWEQYYNKEEDIPFEILYENEWSKGELYSICTKIQSSLNIEKGPLSKLVLFEGRGLFWVIHHLLVDGISWRILLEDLDSLYKDKPLPSKSHSYKAWGSYLHGYDKLEAINNYCKNIPEVTLDFGITPNITYYVVVFSEEKTKNFIRKAQKFYDAKANEILLTALAQAIGEYTGYQLSIDLEGHGREVLDSNLDITRTIGWFTSLYPVYLKLSMPNDLERSIQEVKEQLKKIPDAGITYGIATSIKKCIMRAPSKIMFNYFGQWDTTDIHDNVFRLDNNYLGQSFSKNSRLFHDICIDGQIQDGILSFAWKSNYAESVIKVIADGFKKRLEALINYCTKKTVHDELSNLVPIKNKNLVSSIAFCNPLKNIYPLSPIQKGLLFQALYQPDSDVYFIQKVFEINGLNVDYWYHAWHTVINRHESLRASFRWKELEEPLQIIHQQVNLLWTKMDWSEQIDHERMLQKIILSERKKRFDLEKAPLISFNLITLNNINDKNNENKCYFIWNMHHLITDGWCSSIILNEVLEIYNALVNNRKVKLKERKPYKDYITWLLKQNQNAAVKYWQQELFDVIPTHLGSKKFIENSEYTESILSLNIEETNQLNNYAKELGVTVNTVLQGTWSLLLSIYTRQQEVVYGATVSGRNIDLDEVEQIVGIFINTLPVRVIFRADEDLQTLFKRLQIQFSEAQSYGYIPLSIIQSLQKNRELFDTLYIFENYPIQQYPTENKVSDLESNKLNIKLIQSKEKSEYKLSVIVFPKKELEIRLKYAKQYFNQETINNICTHLRELLLNIIQNKDQALGNISLVTIQESNKLNIWNATQHEYSNECAHQLFEAAVEQNKNKVAVVYENKQLTYEILNTRANQLSHYLIKNQVYPEVSVGICVSRSLELVIGLLGILKSGGIYVPLDPEYPGERLEYIMKDANIKILLTTISLKKKFKDYKGKILYLDCAEYSNESISNPNIKIYPENLAYIIYTSGSTGRPKGTLICHDALVNRLKWQQNVHQFSPDDIFLHRCSIGFDLSLWELLAAFVANSKLILLSLDLQKQLNMLPDYIYKYNVTVVHFNPHILSSFLQNDNIKFASKLRKVFCGGEALLKNTYEEFNKKYPIVSLINIYGPTEATIDVTQYDKKYCYSNIVPIGTPIHNTQMYILDQYLNRVPIGTVGEIYIGGIGLARGYLNKPALTAERFIPNPFMEKKEKGAVRLYKTGDLGKYQMNGNIEFLGRTDFQIKIRGFRVNLGEIESVLQSLQGVIECVVLAREDIENQKRLIAYIVLENKKEEEAFIKQCREACQTKLPSYSQPNQIVILEKLPLTSSGKIDRKALPIPYDREGLERYEEPKGLLEKQLAEIWSEILKIAKVSRNDNFFNLGGHSLLASKLVSKVRTNTREELPLSKIFEYPILKDLANYMENKYYVKELLPPIYPAKEKIVPLSLTQQRLWYFIQTLSNTNMYNLSFTLAITGDLNIAALTKSLNTIVKRHEILRSKIFTINGIGYQEVLDNHFNLKIEKLQKSDTTKKFTEKSLLEKIQKEVTKPFVFGKEALFRGLLLDLNNKNTHQKEYILVLTFHHIISDGWSSMIFNEELTECYNSYIKNRIPRLKKLNIQYNDYCIWQRKWLQGEVLEKQLTYWKKQLFKVSTLTFSNKIRPKEPSFRGKYYVQRCAKKLLDRLSKLSAEKNLTLFMILLASFKGTLSKLCRQNDLAIGTPVANRPISEVEKIIGFFTNTLVLRTNCDNNLTFEELMNRVKSTALEAYEHQDVPFGQILEHLDVENDPSRHPIFQVMFSLENTADNETMANSLKLTDLNIKHIIIKERLSKFDLNLNVLVKNEELIMQYEYAEDIFNEKDIIKLNSHYIRFIECILENPKARLSEISIFSEASHIHHSLSTEVGC